jgi:hypothetical protein
MLRLDGRVQGWKQSGQVKRAFQCPGRVSVVLLCMTIIEVVRVQNLNILKVQPIHVRKMQISIDIVKVHS